MILTHTNSKISILCHSLSIIGDTYVEQEGWISYELQNEIQLMYDMLTQVYTIKNIKFTIIYIHYLRMA